MSRQDFLPRSHDDFFRWQTVFVDRLLEKQNSFQIEDAKLKTLLARQSDYTQSYGRASNPDLATRADRVYRDECEAEYRNEIRRVVNECIRYNSRVNDYDRQALMLVVPDRTPTPAAIPLTHPTIEVDFSETRVHIIHLKDEGKTRRSKPDGVRNAEVWAKVGGDAPADDSEMTLAGTPSDGKLRLVYAAGQVGTWVYYQARWVNTRAQAGAFSSVVKAVIA